MLYRRAALGPSEGGPVRIQPTVQVWAKDPPKKPVLYTASGEPLERKNPVGFAPAPEEADE